MPTAARNVLIILALAGAVFALPKGNDSADLVLGLLSLGITVSFVLIGGKLYRENRVDIHGLGDPARAALYGGIAGIVFSLAAVNRLLDTPAGTLVWIAVISGSVYALYRVYVHWRQLAY